MQTYSSNIGFDIIVIHFLENSSAI